MGSRDFLTATPSRGPGANLPPGSLEMYHMMALQHIELLRDIRVSLLKLSPEVRAATLVRGTSNNEITDTNQHEVTFQVGGKPVPVYLLSIYSSYDQDIFLSLDSMSSEFDGIKFVADDVLVLPVTVNTVHITIPTLTGSSCFVNGPASSTAGGFFINAWTIPDYEHIGR